jgi:NADPH:quinone reductase-like Zn-dependent oxidoreductase
LKAVRVHGRGGVDQLRYEETSEPELESAGDVIVRLKAAALNRIDVDLRRSLNLACLSFPYIPGSDGAGEVVAVGSKVSHVKPGDRVCLYPAVSCGRCEVCRNEQEHLCAQRHLLGEREAGTYAEYVRVGEKNCYPIPSGLSFEEAAAFPLSYVTAWRMLASEAGVKPGELVLIVGASGGIGSAALRLGAAFGARIIAASSSEEKLSAALSHGARQAINSGGDFAREVRNLTQRRGVDIVVDCVGGEGWAQSLASLARGGRLVTCGAVAGGAPQTSLRRIFWNHLKIFGCRAGTREDFHQVLNFFDASQTKPIIDRVFPLKDAAHAQRRMEERKHFGKIVLSMDG